MAGREARDMVLGHLTHGIPKRKIHPESDSGTARIAKKSPIFSRKGCFLK